MISVKRCVQCGILKDVEEFRKYTYSAAKNTEGRYRICRSCETINTKYRRDKAYIADNTGDGGVLISERNPEHVYYAKRDSIEQIESLYALLESKGLRTPLSKSLSQKKDTFTEAFDTLKAFYEVSRPSPAVALKKLDVPSELTQWLTETTVQWIGFGLTPEYLQETVYESLKAKYRPQIGVDQTTYLPIYDDTFKDTLNEILKRFDDYEEEYCADEELPEEET